MDDRGPSSTAHAASPSIIDVRLVRTREGRFRALLDGKRVDIPATADPAVALILVARLLEAPLAACQVAVVDPSSVRYG